MAETDQVGERGSSLIFGTVKVTTPAIGPASGIPENGSAASV
jgi:hypothetical protein